MGIINEFTDFLKEYKVTGLAVAVIIGAAATALVQSLVNDIIMPLVSPLLNSGGEWRSATVSLGQNIVLKVGSFAGALINFLILASIVFMVVKLVHRNEENKTDNKTDHKKAKK